jgi:hypothetical protein
MIETSGTEQQASQLVLPLSAVSKEGLRVDGNRFEVVFSAW